MNHRLLDAAFRTVQQAMPEAEPLGGIVLGSGWGEAVRAFNIRRGIPYRKIPGLGEVEVKGHEGQLLLAEAHGRQVLIFQGRRHWYEGAGWEPIAIPIYLCFRFGVSVIVLTNAAGGIRADLAPGDLMVVKDHINAIGFQPLFGRNDPLWGDRFPDMTRVYDPLLGEMLRLAGEELQLRMHTGVYLATSGPAYETPAEVSAFRALGADAVGMSTVPEAILAHALRIRVAALCCITNRAGGTEQTNLLGHNEVLNVLGGIVLKLGALLRNVWGKIVATAG